MVERLELWACNIKALSVQVSPRPLHEFVVTCHESIPSTKLVK